MMRMHYQAGLAVMIALLLISGCGGGLEVEPGNTDPWTEVGEDPGRDVEDTDDVETEPGEDTGTEQEVEQDPDGAPDSGDDLEEQPDPLTWVSDHLVALYTFEEGSGATVLDRSGVAPAMNLHIQNEPAAIWSESGLTFFTANAAWTSDGATRLNEAISNANEITIDAWITPADANQSGPARIITSSVSTSLRNFTLGQHGTSMHGRARSTAPDVDNNGSPGARSPEGLIGTEAVHAVFTRDSTGHATLYVNGNLVLSDTIGGDFSGWQLDYRLALGSELSFERFWVGTFHRIAVYSRALTAEEITDHYQLGVQELNFNVPVYTPPAEPWQDPGTPGGGGGFLWKPISESDGKLVVLFPSSYTNVATACYVVNAAGELVEQGRFVGDQHNGGRQHYRFNHPGSAYGTNLHVIGVTPSGNVHWHIPNGAQRTQY